MQSKDEIPTLFTRASNISENQRELAQRILRGRQPFQMYFNAALEDAKGGVDNRWFYFSRLGGMVLGIDFDDLRIFSIVGDVDDQVLSAVATNSRRTEFHVSVEDAERIKVIGSRRVIREARLRYYQLARRTRFPEEKADVRRLESTDLEMVRTFYARNYDGTIFSEWMLGHPFIGLFIDGLMVSCGGTVVLDRAGKAANIGNFSTDPSSRGRGYGKIVAKALVNRLIDEGIEVFTLGTTEENVPAWKTYEAVGFGLLENRIELEFGVLGQK